MRQIITALLGATALSIACAPAALAADMPVKAPAVVAAYSWSGFYAGVNAGGIWGTSDNVANFDPGFFNPAVPATATAKLNSTGFIGGGQLGYNWQFGNVVTGLEGDINYTRVGKSRAAPVPGFTNTVNDSFQSNWLATFRGRLGYAWDKTMVYGTGGLAVADLSLFDSNFFGTYPATYHKVRTGWTLGGGVEWAFMPRWSVKAEYLYVDLGTITTPFDNPVFGASTYSHKVTESIGRLGVNYKF